MGTGKKKQEKSNQNRKISQLLFSELETLHFVKKILRPLASG